MCDVVSHSLSVAQTALWCFLGQAEGAYTQHSGLTTTQHKKPNLYSELLTNMSTSAAAPTPPRSLLQSSSWASAQELNDKALSAAKLAHQDHENAMQW